MSDIARTIDSGLKQIELKLDEIAKIENSVQYSPDISINPDQEIDYLREKYNECSGQLKL